MLMLEHLKNDLLAELVVFSHMASALTMAQARVAISPEIPEALTPLVNIVPAQLFSYHLTLAKGYDPDQPRTIRKITETR